MSGARLRHRILEDEVLIIGEGQGITAAAIKVDMREARRFGWSLLSDVDPDEADAAHAEQEEKRKAAMKERLLVLLAHAPCGATRAALIIGATKDQVSGILLPLRKCGWVARIDGGTGRARATFALTEKGRKATGLSQPSPASGRTAA